MLARRPLASGPAKNVPGVAATESSSKNFAPVAQDGTRIRIGMVIVSGDRQLDRSPGRENG